MRRFSAIKHLLTHWLPVIGLCLLIFIESSRPLPNVVPTFPLFDKLLHFTAWTVLGFLFFRAYHGEGALAQRKDRLVWLAFLSATLYGISDEIHQHLVPSRCGDILDLLADSLGSLWGAWVGARRFGLLRQAPRH